MKKVRVTVNAGSIGRTLLLFPDPEAAYVWLTEAREDPTIVDRIKDVEQVPLLPGEFIEAEWRGCEYAYEGNDHVKVDLIRFAKAQPTKNASGILVSTHSGWAADCIIPFYDYVDDDIIVELFAPPEDGRLDLRVLFKDDPTDPSPGPPEGA